MRGGERSSQGTIEKKQRIGDGHLINDTITEPYGHEIGTREVKRNNQREIVMEEEILYNILTGKYGEILETHAMWECISALGIKPFKDGKKWCFLYGNNIQDGICGFGKTIFEAAWDFYTNIKTEEVRKEE